MAITSLITQQQGLEVTQLFRVAPEDRSEFLSLPTQVRKEVEYLLAAFDRVNSAVSKERALKALATELQGERGYSYPRLRAKFYDYLASLDWRRLVNAARCPRYARRRKASGLPAEFVAFWQKLALENKRKYRPAWKKLKRLFRAGEHIPGYGTWSEWYALEFPGKQTPSVCPDIYPNGWSYKNITRHNPPKSQEVAARIGQAAAREFLPQVHSTRDGLRFLEIVTFDDVKTDFRVLDPATGQVCDLWLLVAHDKATDVRLGYGMRPARARDDGSQEHLLLKDMKQLAGWVLQRWGIPPYNIVWKVERGTATLSEATALAIKQLSQGRVHVSYASMINGRAPSGYKESAVGNSRAKAHHEAGNNLLHNECGDLPGQTGRRYDVRPTDLAARESEIRALIKRATALSPSLLKRLEYPVLTISQAKAALDEVFARINERYDHACEGFEEIIEWQAHAGAEWQPVTNMPNPQPEGSNVRVRPESPYERAFRISAEYRDQWTRLHPGDLEHFYDDNHKVVTVDEKGEVQFQFEGKNYIFASPSGELFKVGSKFLAYFHSLDLQYLHLTNLPPKGGYVSTWVQRSKVQQNDQRALQEAIAYTQAARSAQFDALNNRHSAEALANAARRARNEALLSEAEEKSQAIEADIVPIAPARLAASSEAPLSPTAAALQTLHRKRRVEKTKTLATVAEAALLELKPHKTEKEMDGHDYL